MNIGTVVEFIESLIKSAPVSNQDGAYGSGMAGAPFSPIEFIKKPQVILRIVSVIFAIIVFGSIASEDTYKHQDRCPIDNNSGACGFAVGIGVIAFLACILFLVLDARFDSFSSIKIRKRAVVLDLVFSGAWGLMWLICFVYLANSWRKTGGEEEEQANGHLIRTAIAFSFFSILTWLMICLLNFLRYRQGVSEIFQGYEDATSGMEQDGYDNFGSDKQAPFNNNNNNYANGLNNGGYQQTNY